jgi:hypothetical protein
MVRRSAPAALALAMALATAAGLAGCATEPALPEPLLPGLDRALPGLDRVVVEQGGQRFTMRRDGERWPFEDAPWRADPRVLRPLLLGLAEARCDEPRTADPARFERIGVDWPPAGADAAGDASAEGGAFARPTARLSVRIDGVPVAIVIGHPVARGGTFVRVENAAHSCLTRVDLRLPARASDWRDPPLWSPRPEAVAWVEVHDAGAPALRVVARDGRYVAESRVGPPADAKADALVIALLNLRQRGLRPLPAATGGTTIDHASGERRLRFETAAGEAWEVVLRRVGAATFATVPLAPATQGGALAGIEFDLPPDVAEPLWASREALRGSAEH